MTNPLSQTQIIASILYGAVLWFLAAMIVRYIGPMGAFVGTALVITYALVIPGTVPAIWLGQKMMGLAKDQLAKSVMIITTCALLLDGLAMNFARGLYGPDPVITAAGAGLIFWGAGVGLVLGIMMERGR
jgi:hypothetical protein